MSSPAQQERQKRSIWATPRAMLNGSTLLRDGRPLVVIGGEIHNSSASSVSAIQRSFGMVRELGANTVLAPVAWDQLEPEEGAFDFTLVDCMVQTAAERGLFPDPVVVRILEERGVVLRTGLGQTRRRSLSPGRTE